ncbi:uncharacterized protein, partial [Chelonus insularis]|uniref:uncharacterized protein n=1 Tax=Chelonus insularis TaxID=460826 RepID=UPI00158CB49E
LANAIDRLQADECYYGMLIPERISLKNKVKKLQLNKKIVHCKPIIRAMIKSIDKHFEISEEASIEGTNSGTLIDNTNKDSDDDHEFGDPSSTIDSFQPSSSQDSLEKYPSVRKIFLKYNTPLPSSAPVERLFSNATMLHLPKYDRLTDEHFEQ